MARREQIEDRLRESPEDLFLNYAYAMELAKEGDVPAAQAAFEQVRQLDENYVPAYFQEGQLLAGADQIDQARAILQAGIGVARRINDTHALGEMTEFLETL